MKDADLFIRLRDLSKKYEDIGMILDIEFGRWGMIFRGYWSIKGRDGLVKLNRAYDVRNIKYLPDTIDIEFLIDEFKEEFEHKIKEWEHEYNNRDHCRTDNKVG